MPIAPPCPSRQCENRLILRACCGLMGEAPRRKYLNRMGRFTGSGELGEYLSDHRCEFETVSGKAAGNAHRRKLRMEPNDKVLVGRHGVETRCGFHDFAGERRETGPQLVDHSGEIRLMNFTID